MYDSLHFGVKITFLKLWNIYITHRVYFNTVSVQVYSGSDVHISHFQKCYFNFKMEGNIFFMSYFLFIIIVCVMN